MKRSAFSFQNPARPHEPAAGIILPEGSDKFDKFRKDRMQSGGGSRGLAALAIPLQ